MGIGSTFLGSGRVVVHNCPGSGSPVPVNLESEEWKYFCLMVSQSVCKKIKTIYHPQDLLVSRSCVSWTWSPQRLAADPGPLPPCCTATIPREQRYFYFSQIVLLCNRSMWTEMIKLFSNSSVVFSNLGNNHCCLEWSKLCVNNRRKEVLLCLQTKLHE